MGARVMQAVREGVTSARFVKDMAHQQSASSMARTTRTPTVGADDGVGGGDGEAEILHGDGEEAGRGVAAHRRLPLHLGRWCRSWGMEGTAAERLAAKSRKNEQSPPCVRKNMGTGPVYWARSVYWARPIFFFFIYMRKFAQVYVTYLSTFGLWYGSI
jgi:hypothetical protein